MLTTENLGLVAWDTEQDDFEHGALTENWIRIDEHDHTGVLNGAEFDDEGNLLKGNWETNGRGPGITTSAIKPFQVVKYLIALGAVGHKQIGVEEVWPENLKDEAVENRHVKQETLQGHEKLVEHSVDVTRLDPNILPVGSVMNWYRLSGSGNTPGDLWEVMDGRSWAQINKEAKERELVGNRLGPGETEYEGAGTIPDLRERFIRGTTVARSDGTHTGGNASVDLAHSHVTPITSLEHVHLIAAHLHGIALDGKHHHTFEGGHQLGSRKNAFSINTTIEGKTTILQSAYLEEFNEGGNSASAPMDQNGEHSHGGVTGFSPAFNTNGATSWAGGSEIGTDTALEGVETTPPFLELVCVMRVR